MKPSKSKILDFKRMIRQYEYCLEDLNDLKEIQGEINSEFGSAIAALKRPDLFDNQRVENLSKEAAEEDEIDNERDPNFKKLFRKVVIKSHPDKLGSDVTPIEKIRKQDLYEQAVKANDEYNWALLITVAIKLEIELGEEYHEYVNELSVESDKVQKEIDNIQGSIAWQWYYAEEDRKDAMLQAYVKHMEQVLFGKKSSRVKILGVGHPRTGTGFTSAILQSWGLDVGHEKLGKDGIVAWQLAIKHGPWPFINEEIGDNLEHDILIYNVRNPKTSIASIVFTEDIRKESLNFRLEQGKVLRSPNRVEQAIYSILRWDLLINQMNPDFTYRIEDQSKDLFEFLKSKDLEIKWVEKTEKVNSRDHSDISDLEQEMSKIRPSLRSRINDYCVRYGYELLFN